MEAIAGHSPRLRKAGPIATIIDAPRFELGMFFAAAELMPKSKCLVVPSAQSCLASMFAVLALAPISGCYASHEVGGDICCDVRGVTSPREGECDWDARPIAESDRCEPYQCCRPNGESYPVAGTLDLPLCLGSDEALPPGAVCQPQSVACCGPLGEREIRSGTCLDDEVQIGLEDVCDWMMPNVACCSPDGEVTLRNRCEEDERALAADEGCVPAPAMRCCAVDGSLSARESCLEQERALRAGESCEPVLFDTGDVHACGAGGPIPRSVILHGSGCCPHTACEVTQRGDRIDIAATIDRDADDCACATISTQFRAPCDFSTLELEPMRQYQVFLNGRPLAAGVATRGLDEERSSCRAPGRLSSPGCDDSAFSPWDLVPDRACWRRDVGGHLYVDGYFECGVHCLSGGFCEANTSVTLTPEGSRSRTRVRFTHYDNFSCLCTEDDCPPGCPPICEEQTLRCPLSDNALTDEQTILVDGVEVPRCSDSFD